MIVMVIATLMQFVCVLAIGFSCWSLVCANKTSAQLNRVLAAIRFRPMSGPQILNALHEVNFFQHYWALIFFRDPWKLYDPIVLDAVENPRTEVMELVRVEGLDTPPAVH